MTTPPIDEFEVMQREVEDLRQAALEVHQQRRRKHAIRVWRMIIIALVVVGTLAAFALGVALVVASL